VIIKQNIKIGENMFLDAYLPFIWLIIFGNIENLILASQGVVKGANPLKLGIVSIICVIIWLVIGTIGTSIFIDYANIIDFIGGLAIFILGLQSMIEAIRYNKDPELE
jgi:putative Mn2+ efflux pump MntP